MYIKKMIPADEFCASHNIEISFIRTLQETGLIKTTSVQESGFIPASQLHQLERIVRLYYDLDINLEGIETITYLLHRIEEMNYEISRLKNALRFYEPDEFQE